MKKNLPYIFGSLVILAVILLFVTGKKDSGSQRRMDEHVTLRKRDKIPYGTWVAYSSLHDIFPVAKIFTDRHEPGYWDSLFNYKSGQAYIVITDRFSADEDELKRLIRFAENGNDVFVSARTVSVPVENMLHCETTGFNSAYFIEEVDRMDRNNDSLQISLSSPPYDSNRLYIYPGFSYSHAFSRIDTTTTTVLGYDKDNRPNFIQLRAGSGNFYLQLAPLAFSNYFLLHKNNFSYYEKALSVISPEINRLVWDEYYLTKRNEDDPPVKKRGLLGVLFRYPPLKWAVLTAIFTLVMYTLLEMRRKQRIIPVMTRPSNDSLDFVKTIGRLYFDKGDHHNLCSKMAAYFLEHVRNKYKLSTGNLDEEFTRSLVYKSGAPEYEVRGIVSFIRYLKENFIISARQVTEFHKQLESFYKTA